MYGYVAVVLLSSMSSASQRTVDFAFLAPFAMCRRPLYAVCPPSFETEREMIFEVVSGARCTAFPPVS